MELFMLRHPIIYIFSLIFAGLLIFIGNIISEFLESRRVKKYYKSFYSIRINVLADECEYIIRTANGEKVFGFNDLLKLTRAQIDPSNYFRIRCEKQVAQKQFVFLSDWTPLSDAYPFKEKYEPITILLNAEKGEYIFHNEVFFA